MGRGDQSRRWTGILVIILKRKNRASSSLRVSGKRTKKIRDGQASIVEYGRGRDYSSGLSPKGERDKEYSTFEARKPRLQKKTVRPLSH